MKNALKQLPKKQQLNENIYDSKFSYLEFVFWKNYIGHTKFLYLSICSCEYHQSFYFNFRFSSRKFQSWQKLAKKITHFTIQFCSKYLTHFANLNSLDIENNMLPQTQPKTFLTVQIFSKHVSVQCQKKYLYCTISWHPRTTFFKHIESKCLHISIYLLNKILVQFQRRSKVLFNKRRDGRGWIIFLRRLAVWALQNILNFSFSLLFLKIQLFFSILILLSTVLKCWNFLDNLGKIVTKFLIRSHILSV